jgi:hypothetical protein
MIPITKNVTVADEWGNTYQNTWLRRARGLVKNGRARWVDENTIRLAHPPELISEDETMEQNDKLQQTADNNHVRYDNDGNPVIFTENEIKELTDTFAGYGHFPPPNPSYSGNSAPAAPPEPPAEIDERYIFEQIKAIAANNDHIKNALRSLDEVSTDGVDGGNGKASAIAEVVQARETTNQQMLRMLEKMYDQRLARNAAPRTEQDQKMANFNAICETLKGFSNHMGGTPDEVFEVIQRMTERLF